MEACHAVSMWTPTPQEYAASVDAMLDFEASRGVRVTGMYLTKPGLELIRRSRRKKWKCGPHDVRLLPGYVRGQNLDEALIEGRQGGRRIRRRVSYVIPADLDRLVLLALRAKATRTAGVHDRTIDAVRKLARLESGRGPAEPPRKAVIESNTT